MKQEDLIEQLEQKLKYTVESLTRDIAVVRKIRKGIIYEANLNFGPCLFMVDTYNTESIRLRFIASKQPMFSVKFEDAYKFSVRFGAYPLEEAKEVPVKDLPLYVGWEWHSDYFKKLLKGA